MSKKAKIIAGFSSAIAIGAGVPTAVVWGLKDKITNSSNSGGSVTPNPTPTPNPSISINDTLLKENVGNDVTDTSILEDLLNGANSDQIKNDFVDNGIITSEVASLIKSLSFKLSDNINQVPGQYVNVDLFGINNNDEEIELAFNIPTHVSIVDFNKTKFLTAILNADINTLGQNLDQDHIFTTIYGFNVGILENSLSKAIAKLSSSSSLLPESDPWLVNFDMQLNDNFVYKTSDNSSTGVPQFTNKIIVEDCPTASTQNININLDALKQKVTEINSTSNLNNLKNNNTDLKNFVTSANVVQNNEWIKNVSLSFSKGQDNYLNVNVSVTLFNNKSESTGNIPTKIKVVDLNEQILKEYFINNVNNSSQIDTTEHLLTTLVSASCGLSSESLSNSTTITNNGTYEEQNLAYSIYNSTIVLNENFCFYDEGANTIQLQRVVNDLKTKILFQYNIDPTRLEQEIRSINNLSNLNAIIQKSEQQLLEYIKTFDIVGDPNLIASSSLTHSVENGKVKLSFTINFTDGNSTTISALTGMNVVTYNEQLIRNSFKNVNNLLSDAQLVNQIVSADSNLSNSSLSTYTTMAIIDNSYVNVDNVPYKKCNLKLLLNENYCFQVAGNTYVNSATISDVQTHIRYGYNYSISNVEQYTSTLTTVSNVNSFKGQTQFLDLLRQHDFVLDSSWIESVDNVQYLIKSDGYIYYSAQVNWSDGTNETLSFKTGMKGFSSYNINSLIRDINRAQNDSSITTVAKNALNQITSYGFPANSVKNLNITPNSWYNGNSGVFKTFNIEFVLSAGFAYLDSNNSLNDNINLINDSHDSSSYWSSIPYDMTPNWTEFDSACLKITDAGVMIDFLNNLKANINKYNVYKDINWIKEVNYELNNNNPSGIGTIYTITITYYYTVSDSNGGIVYPTAKHDVKFGVTPIFPSI